MTPELQVLSSKLDSIHEAILSLKQAPAPSGAGYTHRELMANEIDPATADGQTIQKDGSIWATSEGESTPKGTIYQSMYGYISREKDPAMFAKMESVLGTERLAALLAVGGPWARYKSNPNAVLNGGDPNAVTLSYALSNPIVSGQA